MPVQTLDPDQARSVDEESGWFYINNWIDRGVKIRSGNSLYSCLANLTVALGQVGDLNNAEYNGAAGAMSLLPTAGALLGAPTREMWIVYKLVPIAGILSMFLSLGGSITPSNVGDYEDEPFSFGGFIPTYPTRAAGPNSQRITVAAAPLPDGLKSRAMSGHNVGNDDSSSTIPVPALTGSQGTPSHHGYIHDDERRIDADISRFVAEIEDRVEDEGGGSAFLRVWVAMGVQLGLVIAILIPLYFAQRGAVVTWWCQAWGWMWFWYFLVTVVAIFDNLVAAPFTKSWTIRISRAQTGIILDPSASKIYDNIGNRNALEFLRAGPKMNQRVRLATATGTMFSRTAFYVVISVKGIDAIHSIGQVVAKLSSVAVFAFGTALFASATLLSISVALMVLSVVLSAGVGGRVLALWVVATMSRHGKPIVHKMVQNEEEAARYFEALARGDIQMEVDGHVIYKGVVVTSRHKLFIPSTYIGLLAKPFDLTSLAAKQYRGYEIPESSVQGRLNPRQTFNPPRGWSPIRDESQVELGSVSMGLRQ
ncbi:hypothetical protein ONZ43_g6382 [Nemania bipapillata]|uniref:Uncharacterized protein n=1 Tax=Nemania bipapillata TaxID=110536 RepID=A0ACC2I050_9PEZI|nr:hypothetical protein ONZ43_g6382 [Nemania bipapillata]